MAEITLERLLVQVASGDRAAFESLYDRIGTRLHTLMRSSIGHAHGADDCLLETFVDIWRRARGYDPADEPAARWITRVASEHITRVRSTTIDEAAVPLGRVATSDDGLPGFDGSALGATA